jgi:hypothetical protein
MSATSTPSTSCLDIADRSKSAGHRGDDNKQGGTEEQHVKACDEGHVLKSLPLEPRLRCSRQADRQERQTDDHSDKADDPQRLRGFAHPALTGPQRQNEAPQSRRLWRLRLLLFQSGPSTTTSRAHV